MTRHGQHQDTGAGSDGRDEVAGQDLPAVSTEPLAPVGPARADKISSTEATTKWIHKRCIKHKVAEPEALAGLINKQSFHGQDLVMHLNGTDLVARAEKALTKAAAACLIKRGNYDPSREQLFFGVGGFTGNRLPGLPEEHRSSVCFHWITVTFRWLEPADLVEVLR